MALGSSVQAMEVVLEIPRATTAVGIYLSCSNNTIFYHNNFVNNTNQVEIIESYNSAWDNSGNYWSNYNGTDLNRDGIGDTPYDIDANNRDGYPLMNPFGASRLSTDLNGDGKINITDIFLVAQAFGSSTRHPRRNPICDIDGNDAILLWCGSNRVRDL